MQPVAFFDRDGTLIEDQVYQFELSRLTWQPGAIESLKLLNSSGWKIVVVTNQSAVARGICTEADVDAFHQNMKAEAARWGAVIDTFEYCPFLPDAPILRYRVANHPDRKPNPGMIVRHLPSSPLACARSFLVGDKLSDIAAANAAGIPAFLYIPGSNLLEVVNRAMLSTGL